MPVVMINSTIPKWEEKKLYDTWSKWKSCIFSDQTAYIIRWTAVVYEGYKVQIAPLDNISLPKFSLLMTAVMSLLIIQRARIQILVRSVFCLGFFSGFPSTVRRMSYNLGRICPWVPFGHHNDPKPSSVYGRRRSLASAAVHGRR